MASSDTAGAGGGGGGGEVHLIQMAGPSPDDRSRDEISPLIGDSEVPTEKTRVSIFGVLGSKSRPRNSNPKESVPKAAQTEVSLLQFASWAWGGSRYSGLACMASASTIYCTMELLIVIFSVRSIPLFEIVFTRCTIMLILSFMWLRRMGQPILGPTNTRTILISRAIVGYLSLVCFIYSIQNLPLSYGILLNLASPIMASFAARVLLSEKLTIPDIGGLTCSFLAVLFIYHPTFSMQGKMTQAGQEITIFKDQGIHTIYPVLVGILSMVAGGISYCLVKSAAKATDQPVLTVLVFSAFGCPLSAICSLTFEKVVLLDISSLFVSIILGVLAFFGEVFLARGLQLEKTSKAMNALYLKVLLMQIWSMLFFESAPTFGRIIGCSLLLASICSTIYLGPQKETE